VSGGRHAGLEGQRDQDLRANERTEAGLDQLTVALLGGQALLVGAHRGGEALGTEPPATSRSPGHAAGDLGDIGGHEAADAEGAQLNRETETDRRRSRWISGSERAL
jgi:hypothetical protein